MSGRVSMVLMTLRVGKFDVRTELLCSGCIVCSLGYLLICRVVCRIFVICLWWYIGMWGDE